MKVLELQEAIEQQRLTTREFFIIPQIGRFRARVDTGATTCSLHALDIEVQDDFVIFTTNGQRFKAPLAKISKVKNANGKTNRAVIRIPYEWNGIAFHNVATTLMNRSKMRYPLLIGRNLLKLMNLPVFVHDKD